MNRSWLRWITQNSYIQSNNIFRRFLIGGFWSVLGIGIGQGFTLAAHVILARRLGPSNYGELGLVLNTISMLGLLAGTGLGQTGTKHLAEFRDIDPEKSGRILGLTYSVGFIASLGFAVALILFAPLLANEALNAPHLDSALRVGGIMLCFSAIDGMQMGALAGFEAFYSITLAKSIFGLTIIPAALIGVELNGVQGAVIGFTLATAGACVVNYIFLHRECKKRGIRVNYAIQKPELRLLWTFAIPTAMSGFMVAPITWLANTILANTDNGYEELGLFYAAWQWRAVVLFLPIALNNVLLALLSQQGEDGSERFQSFNIFISWILGISLAVPLLVFPETVSWIYGNRYDLERFNRILSLVMFSTLILTYKDGLARILASKSLMWWGVMSNSLWAVVLICSTLVLKHYAAMGLGVAYIAAFSANTVVFIPFYLSRGLAPRSTMLSWQVITIWAGLAVLMSFVLLNVSWPIRGIGLLVFAIGAGFLFVQLLSLQETVRSFSSRFAAITWNRLSGH